jgi:hypothetical protein
MSCVTRPSVSTAACWSQRSALPACKHNHAHFHISAGIKSHRPIRISCTKFCVFAASGRQLNACTMHAPYIRYCACLQECTSTMTRRYHFGRNLSVAMRRSQTSSHGVQAAIPALVQIFHTGMSAAHCPLGCGIVLQSMHPLYTDVSAALCPLGGIVMQSMRPTASWGTGQLQHKRLHAMSARPSHPPTGRIVTARTLKPFLHRAARHRRPLGQEARCDELTRRRFIRHRTADSRTSGAGGCGRRRGRGRLLLGSLRSCALRVPARLEAHRCVLRTVSDSYSSSVSGSPLCSQAMQPARMPGHLSAHDELCLSGCGAQAAWLLARRRAHTRHWLLATV